ncbi:aminotransferase [Glutamicibacter sp. PS]|uniref:aminotransferase n=1 Tax=Glutamicibacter sp. PS TaxID=3075634 RepID=UPI00284E724C|nr:aminotransferase [Glutamicibacter sp. PS]MDR4534184.1 aminotransferase [Glutamicibacter sp. PS]
MEIEDFGVEIWMNAYENNCTYNLAETCVDSLTVGELLDLAGERESILDELSAMRLGYGAIAGREDLRELIAKLYTGQKAGNILTTHGAIGANALVHQTLVEPGDHVVAIVPTYQQHYSIPRSLGAEVSLLPLREENGFLPDLEELAALLTPQTKLIALNNPNNPTGALIDATTLQKIADLAALSGAWVLCDEVYRGIDQQAPHVTASIADLYAKGISTASMSKSFSMAGLRMGWIAAPEALIERIMIHRDYNTISVGMIDEAFAAMALRHAEKILARSRELTATNLSILDAWVQEQEHISFVKPGGGTTALLKYSAATASHDYAVEILEGCGVLFTPGSALGMEGYLRIGYANETEVLRAGLAAFAEFLNRG